MRTPSQSSQCLPTHATALRSVAAALLAALALAPALSAAPTPASLTPLDADTLVHYEGFEGPGLGAGFSTNDTNPGNGSDYWANSQARAFAGNGSAWSAGTGSQTLFWTSNGGLATDDPYVETWENATMGAWVTSDQDGTNGTDNWGISTFRVHGGSYSLWAAQVGFNEEVNDTNANAHLYDNGMDTIVYRDVNFGRLTALNFTGVTLDYWYWLDSEQNVDFLYVVYWDGAQWRNLNLASGNSGNWQQGTVDVPLTAQRVGFRFVSDGTGILEGAYIDDIDFHAQHDEPNNGILGFYDVSSNTTMSRAFALGAYAAARVEYRYWLETDSGNDTLSVAYLVGSNWTTTDVRSGSSGGWQFGNTSVPVTATRIGFRFASDAVGHAAGAFVDELRVFGRVFSIVCNGTASTPIGYEATTTFSFAGGATQGLLPYSWSWNFSDGVRVNAQNATRLFNSVGNYTANLTVMDAAGQSCTAATVTVEVVHDTTSITISPAAATVVEGGSVTFAGLDRRGHPFPINWGTSPALCANLTNTTGLFTDATFPTEAGGTSCLVTGSYSGATTVSVVNVSHNVSLVTVDPPSASVAEGGSVVLRAYDVHAHNLLFVWTATCGNLSVTSGFSVTFTATVEPGNICRVTASLTGGLAIVDIEVVPDTSRILISPALSALAEGANQTFAAFDNKSRPLAVNWSVSAAACGYVSDAQGPTTTFHASQGAGGLACAVSAAFAAASSTLSLVMNHDTSLFQVVPVTVTIREGELTTVMFADRYGHPFDAEWTLTPTTCGSFTEEADFTVTFASGDSPGIPCTLSGRLGSLTLRSTISIQHGPVANLTLVHRDQGIQAGETVLITTRLWDSRDHQLPPENVTWSSTCAALSVTSAPMVDVTFSNASGGTTCTVTATYGSLTRNALFTIHYAAPFNVTIEPAGASVASGGTQTLTAHVSDAFGNPVPDADVRWSASCGQLSRTTGASVTFTAPSDLGGSTCAVSATVAGTAAVVPGMVTVTAGMSVLVPVMLAAVAAAAGVGVFMWWRKRPKKPSAASAAAGEGEPGKPAFEVDIR